MLSEHEPHRILTSPYHFYDKPPGTCLHSHFYVARWYNEMKYLGKWNEMCMKVYFIVTWDYFIIYFIVAWDYFSTLLPPHIPYGIHVEWIHSMWNPWIPHGFHMEWDSFHMDSTWNRFHSTWIPHGMGFIPHGFHSEWDSFHMDSTWNGIHSTWIPHGMGFIPHGFHMEWD